MFQMNNLGLAYSDWLPYLHLPGNFLDKKERFKPHHESRPPPTLNVIPQASESQIAGLSQPSGFKAYRPRQREEVERPIGWIEEQYVDLTQGTLSRRNGRKRRSFRVF